MASIQETNDDDSFIILGTSPGSSLDLKCDGVAGAPLDRVALDDAIRDLSDEASMAFKAHFKLGDGPSPASLMVASNIITDDKSTEELQKRFGELLDENVILKETLQKNNESMKEQFLLIASCQEDMMKTHMLHKEKFDETKDLVDKLRQENKKLKVDIARLTESEDMRSGSAKSSGPPSAVEFVSAPDDDTFNKLTAQLELVEKQRRQVIVENEKLTWQKESLEHIVDATSKERDDLKEKVKSLELQLVSIENEHLQKVRLLNDTIKDLQNRLEIESSVSKNIKAVEFESKIESLERANASKILSLQNELKQAQLKILDLENVKLEFSKHKSGVSDTVRMYKEQIHDLQKKLKEAHTTVFQPMLISISAEPDSTGSGEFATFMSNVKMYDKTLKHLADLLNILTHGSVDSLVHCLGVVASLHDFKLERNSVDQVKSSLQELRTQLDKQHSNALSNIGQVRGILSIFEGIFKDYKQVLKRETTKQEPQPSNVEQLTRALVARGQELQTLQSEVTTLRNDKDDKEVLKAQLELYKSDFEAERESREKMASEKETILADLRTAQRRVQELTVQLDDAVKSGSSQQAAPKAAAGLQRPGAAAPSSSGPGRTTGTRRQSTPAAPTAGNVSYTCPKCLRFSSANYSTMEDHFDFCLDDF